VIVKRPFFAGDSPEGSGSQTDPLPNIQQMAKRFGKRQLRETSSFSYIMALPPIGARMRGKLPVFTEQPGVQSVRIAGAFPRFKARKVPVARRGEVSGSIGPIRSQATVDDYVAVRAQRIGIEQGRNRTGRRKMPGAERHVAFCPAQRRQLSIELRDPAVAARIPEQHQVVACKIVRDYIRVILMRMWPLYASEY
jgi:hypothetical protein